MLNTAFSASLNELFQLVALENQTFPISCCLSVGQGPVAAACLHPAPFPLNSKDTSEVVRTQLEVIYTRHDETRCCWKFDFFPQLTHCLFLTFCSWLQKCWSVFFFPLGLKFSSSNCRNSFCYTLVQYVTVIYNLQGNNGFLFVTLIGSFTAQVTTEVKCAAWH